MKEWREDGQKWREGGGKMEETFGMWRKVENKARLTFICIFISIYFSLFTYFLVNIVIVKYRKFNGLSWCTIDFTICLKY